MEKKIHSLKYARQRKFLVALPLLTLPFLTFMFWALGGGSGSAATAHTNTREGLNLKLPDARFKNETELNKLSFYQQAALDAAKTKEAEKLDPYWHKSIIDSGMWDAEKFSLVNNGIDANQMKVYDKLDELKTVLNKSQEAARIPPQTSHYPYSSKSYSSSNDVERLQSLMREMNEDKTEDPEIKQLNEMLDKIQAIQHPEQPKTISKTSARKTLAVKPKNSIADISFLKRDTNKVYNSETMIAAPESNAFYSTASFDANDDSSFSNAIEAIVPETQTIVAGSTIKLALSNAAVIQDITIPAGSLIYGATSLVNERLKIEITSIRFQNSILPVSLNVYDLDGQEGIYVPGSINRTVAKESANNALRGMSSTTIDPSIVAQAASVGIEAAKNLFGKKIKLIKMTVNAGYRVLLKDNHDK